MLAGLSQDSGFLGEDIRGHQGPEQGQDIRGADPRSLDIIGGDMAPSPEDMEKAAEALRFNKQTLLEDFATATFDLSRPRHRAQYRELMATLYRGSLARTHKVTYFDRQFVTTPPRWLVHVEWVVFKLKVTPVPVVGGGKGKSA